MKRLALILLALGFVASAAAIPAHAQAMQNQGDSRELQDSVNMSASENTSESVERGSVDSDQKPVRRGPPAFVQNLVPQHALQNMPDFFW